MKKIIFVFVLALLLIGIAYVNAQTTATQQLGTHPLSYNGNTVYKEGRCISFSWNGDSLNRNQNGITVLIRVLNYYKSGNVKVYLDSLNDSTIPINPWVSRVIIVKALPGVFIDPNTTLVVPEGTTGAVDEFLYWSQLFPTVFNSINSQVVLENSLGRL